MSKIWTFCLQKELSFQSSIKPNFGIMAKREDRYELNFRDANDVVWLSITRDGEITVAKSYAWDGCSPKYQMGWLQIGTPDGAPNPKTGYPYTYFASCLHDALLQFLDDPRMPYTRAQIDAIFYECLVRDEFPAAWLYYRAVRLYSGWRGFVQKIKDNTLRMGL